jgi:asparagine synthase (glutamine-hydrolysing)
MDQPTVDGVNSWVISRAVRDAGAVVALSGLGGDELFQGYSTFRHVPRLVRIGGSLSLIPASIRHLPAAVAARNSQSAHSRARRALEAMGTGGWGPCYAAVRGLFSVGEIERIWPGWQRIGGRDPAPEADGAARGNAVCKLELSNYLPFQLLRDTDAMSMAHSIEVRVPLLDDEVVRVALRSPKSVGGLRGKRLLASAVDQRLLALTRIQKRTFTLPFDSWLRGALGERVAGALNRLTHEDPCFDRAALREIWEAFSAGRAEWRQVWALAVLGMWLDGR